jgi:hypothetical protein
MITRYYLTVVYHTSTPEAIWWPLWFRHRIRLWDQKDNIVLSVVVGAKAGIVISNRIQASNLNDAIDEIPDVYMRFMMV